MFDKILLPVDVNHPESWAKAAPAALKTAGSDGEIHLLSVVYDLGVGMISSYLPEDFEEQAMKTAKVHLAEIAADAFPQGTRVHTHVALGHVSEGILRVAEQTGADLIVMAAHPAGDITTFLVGSNTEKVVRHAKVPVLVVR